MSQTHPARFLFSKFVSILLVLLKVMALILVSDPLGLFCWMCAMIEPLQEMLLINWLLLIALHSSFLDPYFNPFTTSFVQTRFLLHGAAS